MNSLSQLAEKHGTDKLWHGYCPAYWDHFETLRDEPVALLEIGVASGASLRMWDEWFTHPMRELIGVEIVPECSFDKTATARVVTGDGTQIDNPLLDHNEFDIIIDDGSHTSEDILAGYYHWWPHLRSDGWYVIEDLAVQWRNDSGGGGKGSPATDYLKWLLGQLWQHDDNTITEFHAYNEIVFLRKA